MAKTYMPVVAAHWHMRFCRTCISDRRMLLQATVSVYRDSEGRAFSRLLQEQSADASRL